MTPTQFNQLNGQSFWRHELRAMVRQAQAEKEPQVANRLRKFLRDHPGVKRFEDLQINPKIVVTVKEKKSPTPSNKQIVKEEAVTKEKNTPFSKTHTELIRQLGGVSAAGNPPVIRPKISLKGEIGKIISQLDRYMALILVKGNRHTSKSEFLMQLAHAFGESGLTVAYIDGEQGGLDASVTRECRNRNTTTESRPFITIFPAIREMEKLEQLTKAYDVILADSVQELGLTADQLGQLRQQHTDTIFGFISMVKEGGAMYGGNKMEHHPPMIFECHQGEYSDPTEKYKYRYVTCEKNRGNPEAIGLKYHIYQKKTGSLNEEGIMKELKKMKE
ncbi:MAG: hypothetical protein AB8B61_00505 [Cyclobacteriaceae bacterium]